MYKKTLLSLTLTATVGLGNLAAPVFAEEVPAPENAANSTVCFYVSPNGNDLGEGSEENPLATIEGARDKVREYKNEYGLPTGGITVYFKTGNYKITDRAEFEERDSGTDDSPIVYTAAQGEKPVFNGGYYVPGAEFHAIDQSDSAYSKLKESARNHVLTLNLKNFYDTDNESRSLTDNEIGQIPTSVGIGKDHYWIDGVVHMGKRVRAMDVYVDDQYMDLARYPNKNFEDSNLGWLYVGQVIKSVPSWEWATGQKPVFVCNDTRFKNWSSFDDIHIKGYLNWDYYHDDVGVENIDTDTKQITLADNTNSGQVEGKRFYFYNILDELDAPGEYYVDRKNGTLYIYSEDDISDSTVKLATYSDQFMVSCKDVSNVVFDNLTFELTRGSVFSVIGGENVEIRNSTLKNIGGKAVWLGKSNAAEGDCTMDNPDLEKQMNQKWDNLENGRNHTVYGCEMYNLGYGGVTANGGNIYTLDPSGFTVENNRIHNWGLKSSSYDNAVNFYGYGFRVAHNEMYDAPNGAIQSQAMGAVVEYNEIYDVVKEVEDAAAVYTNYCWPIHDYTFRYNYIHDIPTAYTTNDNQEYVLADGKKQPYGHTYWNGGYSARIGFYTDSDLFRPTVYGNVFADMPIGYYNSGKGELVKNNVFVNCDLSVGGCTDTEYLKNANVGYTISGADALKSDYKKGTQLKYWDYFPFESNKWKNAYPEFTEWMEKWKGLSDASHWTGEIINNVMVNSGEENLKFTYGNAYTKKDNLNTNSDPGFENMAGKNYQIKSNSAVLKTIPNFEIIDMSRIGTISATGAAE